MVSRSMFDKLRNLSWRLTSVERRLAKVRPSVNPSRLASPGDVKITARATAPDGWLLCDGASLLRADYPALFQAIGTQYGAADSAHFSLPDIRGRVPVGLDAGQPEFDTLGGAGGEKVHELDVSEMPAHSHGLTYNNASLPNGALQGASGAGSFVNWFLGNSAFSTFPDNSVQVGSNGGGQGHNNLQPYIVLRYVIKS